MRRGVLPSPAPNQLGESRIVEPMSIASAEFINLEDRYGAHNYNPLPVVIREGEGAWVTDVAGKRYLDFLSAYSALNFGHRHPRLVRAAAAQIGRLTLTSRAFHNDQLGPFCEELATLCRLDRVLPMNSGAEAVESAVKVARAWGYRIRGIPDGQARIVVAGGNFHGRTTTIISFSDDPVARADFGPFTPGFITVPFGDVEAMAEAIAAPNVVAFLVEPVQGEAGVVVPPDGYLRAARAACSEAGVLLIADEVQSGLGRTGATFACDHEGIQPDVLLLGKALGGGIVPLSAVITRDEILAILRPGEHGSTFGGNPLAMAIGREVIAMLETGEYQRASAELGNHLHLRLRDEAPAGVERVQGRGLWAGIVLRESAGGARASCERLLDLGLLAKETQVNTVRLAPPLMISREDLDHGIDLVLEALAD